MSATNRKRKGKKTERQANDYYATPDWLIDAIIDQEIGRRTEYKNVLEPGVGEGAIVDRLLANRQNIGNITGVDIVDYPNRKDNCKFIQQDYRHFALQTSEKFDLILGNPPFTLAREFITASLPLLASYGKLILLLRLNFYGGQRRSSWLESHMPDRCWVTPKRPIFVGKTSDATEYAWFVWEQHDECPLFTQLGLLPTWDRDKYS
jgi:hypothetical protein